MAENNKQQHWHLQRDDDQIAWLTLDKADAAVNVLAVDVMAGLDSRLHELESQAPRGLVILSGKRTGFIAGADINSFTTMKSQEEAAEFMRGCHTVMDRLESFSFPTVAMINGFCLGGGLELALACRYRIAEDGEKTRLGLPEVKLGIHPGFGGTLRSVRLLGAPAAMDLMLSGRTINARAAQRMGLVDYAVPERQLLRAARMTVLNPPPARRPKWWLRMTNHKLARPLLARYLRRMVAKRAAKEHYPAPYALIDLWEKYAGNPRTMLAEEALSVARLVIGDTAQNLIRVFFLQEQMKAVGKASDFKAARVHVIGAGVMGGDIAAWCALRGLRVTLQDQAPERIAPAMKRAHGLFKKQLKQPHLVQAAMDRLMPDTEGLGVCRADVIIEAIFENTEAKQALYQQLEPQMKPGALLATNTSSIPLQELSTVLKQPERLVGLHFFNPVAKMQLVEIVAADNTLPEVCDQAAAFAGQIGRLPLPVTSTPGFLVNRILMPYLLEAVVLESEGVRPELIDKAAVGFGMPMGPIELADTVGLDICLSVAEILSQSMNVEVPERLRELVKGGFLGRKSGQGFYTYKKGKPVKGKLDKGLFAAADVKDRMIMRLLNESVACLREHVVADADLLDGGIIFGTGFAPFRGGPLHYVRESGVSGVREILQQLEKAHGDRFHPDDGWKSL
jgi:3-hydroxyacyl-CoA dehydrogenase/enoyl-CoA hydratase/3-hydroxybutyryl-CoA epimerase